MLPRRFFRSSTEVDEAEDRHHLGGDHDVEAVLARIAVGGAAERDRDVAQRAVVHVEDALPGDAADVDPELVAVVDVVVDHRREQVVGELDRAEVAGEVEVDVLHRHHLRVAAAGRAALHAEHRAERGLAQADHRLLADVVERVAEADRGGRLALARRRGADGRDQDQLAVRAVLERVEVLEGDLRLVVAVGLEVLVRDAELRSCAILATRCILAAWAISMSDGMSAAPSGIARGCERRVG